MVFSCSRDDGTLTTTHVFFCFVLVATASQMNLEGTIHADVATMLVDATKAVADAGEWRLACSLLARLPEPRPIKT